MSRRHGWTDAIAAATGHTLGDVAEAFKRVFARRVARLVEGFYIATGRFPTEADMLDMADRVWPDWSRWQSWQIVLLATDYEGSPIRVIDVERDGRHVMEVVIDTDGITDKYNIVDPWALSPIEEVG